jgi:hypothetical protein
MTSGGPLKTVLNALRAAASVIYSRSFPDNDCVVCWGWSLRNDLCHKELAEPIFLLLTEISEKYSIPLVMESKLKVAQGKFSTFYRILEESYSNDFGEVLFSAPGSESSLILNWSKDPEIPFSEVQVTLPSAIFKEPALVQEFVILLKKLNVILGFEYFFATHSRDADVKLRVDRAIEKKIQAGELGNPPSYRSKPARSIPFVPWLMFFGPKYVDFFSIEKLNSLPCFIKEEVDDSFLVLVSENPLEYKSDEVRRRESQIRTTLGVDAFRDPTNPHRMASGPEYPVEFKKFLWDLDEKWINKPGEVWDVYPDEIVKRKRGENDPE